MTETFGMGDCMRIPVVVLRGGTSKTLLLKRNDMQSNPTHRDAMTFSIFGTPGCAQLGGLGGGDVLTSKQVIIEGHAHPGADVDYTFGQVSLEERYIDESGNCGDVAAAVAQFAVEDTLVSADEPITTVRLYNRNTGKVIVAKLSVFSGKPKMTGTGKVDGVPGINEPILLDFAQAAGTINGHLLPTGNETDVLQTSRGPVEVTIVDVGSPCCFVKAAGVGLHGMETHGDLEDDFVQCAYLEEVRAACCKLLGMDGRKSPGGQLPIFPLLGWVSKAQQSQADLTVRMLYGGALHPALPACGAASAAVAACLPGGVVHSVATVRENRGQVVLAHPAGYLTVAVKLEQLQVKQAELASSAGRLMEGHVFMERARLFRELQG